MAYLSQDAIIPEAKLTKYLLVWKPKDDKSQFLAQAGYHLDNWQQLEKDLREQILPLDAVLVKQTEWGMSYNIIGSLTGPNGVTLQVITGWIVDFHPPETRFVTLIPKKKDVNFSGLI
jgi:hypothetical protein